MDYWVNLVHDQYRHIEYEHLYLVGNKIDLLDSHEIYSNKMKVAEHFKINNENHFVTSCKIGNSNESFFNNMIQKIKSGISIDIEMNKTINSTVDNKPKHDEKQLCCRII